MPPCSGMWRSTSSRLGPEATLAIVANRTIYGFVTVRYQWEIGARTTTEECAWNILASLSTEADPAAVTTTTTPGA